MFEREELQALRDKANGAAKVTGNLNRKRAYEALADAADYLDAIILRSRLRVIPPPICCAYEPGDTPTSESPTPRNEKGSV